MPKQKFYAVFNNVTFVSNIFNSWDEAKVHISGFNVAQKSFGSQVDANQFIQEQKKLHGLPLMNNVININIMNETITVGEMSNSGTINLAETKYDPSVLTIYTDGSHIKGTNRRGAGGVVFYKGKQFRFAVNSQAVNQIFKNEASNPSLELLGATIALTRLHEIFDEKEKKPQAIIFTDYEGVEFYLKEIWKVKALSIDGKGNSDDFRRQARKLMEIAIHWKGKLTAKHVVAHSDDMGNDLADMMAKCGEIVDELDGLKIFVN